LKSLLLLGVFSAVQGRASSAIFQREQQQPVQDHHRPAYADANNQKK